MEPKKVGRTLGIGVRVASNMVRQRVEQAAQASANRPPAPPSAPLSARVVTAKRGARAFGQAFLGPFTHAGKVLWLEMTGLFFALFALFFAQSVYRVRSAWRQGPEHSHLLLYCVLAAAFAWFSFSSFARAYRRNKQGPRGSSSK
jgi:hypothetical protein